MAWRFLAIIRNKILWRNYQEWKKKEPKPKFFGPDIFRWGRCLPRERVGAKKFDTSLETTEIKLFGRDIPGFCRDIPGAPEKFEKKKFVFNFRSLLSGVEKTDPVQFKGRSKQWVFCKQFSPLRYKTFRSLEKGEVVFQKSLDPKPHLNRKGSVFAHPKLLERAIHGPIPVQGETLEKVSGPLVHTNFPRKKVWTNDWSL